MKYNYELLNYWNDHDDLYVDYIVTNEDTDEKAHACTLLNTDMIENYISRTDIDDELISIISKYNGKEFNLPKTSQLNEVTYNIFKDICQSDNNMLWIEYSDEFEYYGITNETYELLKQDIEKYSLQDYFELSRNNITVYGGLQCCFNDDRGDRSDELER